MPVTVNRAGSASGWRGCTARRAPHGHRAYRARAVRRGRVSQSAVLSSREGGLIEQSSNAGRANAQGELGAREKTQLNGAVETRGSHLGRCQPACRHHHRASLVRRSKRPALQRSSCTRAGVLTIRSTQCVRAARLYTRTNSPTPPASRSDTAARSSSIRRMPPRRTACTANSKSRMSGTLRGPLMCRIDTPGDRSSRTQVISVRPLKGLDARASKPDSNVNTLHSANIPATLVTC